MQNNRFRDCLQMSPVLLFMAFVSVSCIKDDPARCGKPAFTLQVKAYDADNRPLGTDDVKDVTLYVFDRDRLFLESLHTRVRETVTLDYPGHPSLTLVAWGNGRQGSQTMPGLEKGDRLESAFVSLAHTRTSVPVAASPDDLLHGLMHIQADGASAKELPLRRKTASVIVTARHLREYVGSAGGGFRYVLRKSTDKLDFYGKPNGTDVHYSPEAEFDGKGDFVSSIFNILPTDNDLKIDIYHDNVLKTTIVSDNGGNPLRAVEGRLLNVFVNFRGDISVEMRVTEWGRQEIWKEF